MLLHATPAHGCLSYNLHTFYPSTIELLYDAGESDVESTRADTYEFLGELCYLNQDCDAPFVIENANYEAVQMRYNILLCIIMQLFIEIFQPHENHAVLLKLSLESSQSLTQLRTS